MQGAQHFFSIRKQEIIFVAAWIAFRPPQKLSPLDSRMESEQQLGFSQLW